MSEWDNEATEIRRFEYPEELKFSLRALTTPRRVRELIKRRKEHKDLNYPALRPLYDRGGAISVYSGPSGPIVTLSRIMDNISKGKPAGEGIPPNALNDPNSP